MLNLSYKWKLCKGQARPTEDKFKVELGIKDAFKAKLGMFVGQSKHDYESTNDGNSA